MNKKNDAENFQNEKNMGPPMDSYARLSTPSRRFYMVAAVVSFIITLFVIYQTEVCLVALGRLKYGPKAFEDQTRLSKNLKSEVMMKCSECSLPASIVPHPMFDDEQKELISRAAQSLVSDSEMVKSFPKFDGLSLDQTIAIVLPIWKLNHREDWQQMGLTEAGVICGQDDTDDPMGTTIRERPIKQQCLEKLKEQDHKIWECLEKPGPDNLDCPRTSDGTPQMTKDGVPRIALSASLINPETLKELKYTLLHEAVHAHEVPGFKPLWSLAHTDLSYLPEYNRMVDRLNLASEESKVDYVLWGFVAVGLYIAFGSTYKFIKAKE